MLEHAAQLRANGYTLFDSLIPAAQTRRYGAAMRGIWRELGEPSLFSQADVILGPGVHVSPVGMACAGILERIPELAQLLLTPVLLALFGELLGPGFELEYGAGVISDHSRGVFFWHHHIGGIDHDDTRGLEYPTYDRVERIGCTLYASPLDEEHGVLLVSPRRVDQSTAPPHPPGREPWPGQTRVLASLGSVIVFEQGTWHSVTPMTCAGQRCFFGFFVRRAGLPPARRSDPGTELALARNPGLRLAYGGQESGDS